MKRRWDGDERGRGIADGRWLAGDIGELLAVVKQEDWVAESPELHLLPHLEAACRLADSSVALETTEVSHEGGFMVDLRWRGDKEPSIGQIRAAVFNLIGAIAESVTFVRQRRNGPSGVTFEIATGTQADSSAFAPHGHTVVFHILQ